MTKRIIGTIKNEDHCQNKRILCVFRSDAGDISYNHTNDGGIPLNNAGAFSNYIDAPRHAQGRKDEQIINEVRKLLKHKEISFSVFKDERAA